MRPYVVPVAWRVAAFSAVVLMTTMIAGHSVFGTYMFGFAAGVFAVTLTVSGFVAVERIATAIRVSRERQDLAARLRRLSASEDYIDPLVRVPSDERGHD